MDSTSAPAVTVAASETQPITPAPSSAVPAATPATASPIAASPASPSVSALDGDAAKHAAVVPAFEDYWDVINQTYAAGGAAEATPDMLRTMSGQQLDFWVQTFASWKVAGHRPGTGNKQTC